MSVAKTRTWSASFVLPYAAGPSAMPDRKAKGHFRHREIVTAPDERAVIHDLTARHPKMVPVEVREIKPAHPLFGGRVSKDFKQQFLLTMTFSVQCGMSPGRALEQAIESETGPMRQRLNVGLNALRQGRSFLEALRAIDIYDPTTMAIIEAGEETGTLRQALATAEAHLQKGNEIRKTILSTLSWTVIDLVMAVMSIFGVRTGLIPYIRSQNTGVAKDVEALNSGLDLATTVNDVLIVLTVLAIFGIIVGAYGYFSNNDEFRSRIDSILLKLPIVRTLMTNTAISSTCGVMTSLLSGGVNFIPATVITERGTRMMTVVRYWRTARTRVESGEPPTAATAMEPFTDSERMILRAHGDSKMLARAYDQIRIYRDEQAKSASKRFLFAALAVTVGYSMIGVLLVLYVVFLQNQATMNMSFGA